MFNSKKNIKHMYIMSTLGWYCDEVTYNGGAFANVVFAEWKININNIDSTIYFLNKQPIPDGITLSFSDWTPITLTNSNYESILLNPGIYWYKVVSAEGIALFNKPILSVLVNNREYGIFSHINSVTDTNTPSQIIETILSKNPSYTYTCPQNDSFLTNIKDLNGATKTQAEWEAILKGKVEEVFDGSRNSHELIVPFTDGGIHGMMTQDACGNFSANWTTGAGNLINNNPAKYYYYVLEKNPLRNPFDGAGDAEANFKSWADSLSGAERTIIISYGIDNDV